MANAAGEPGRDYVMAEVVHCKSKGEEGVWRLAAETCVDRYLLRLVEQSSARVVLCLGRLARWGIGRVFPILGGTEVTSNGAMVCGPVVIGAIERRFVFLPHPNARTTHNIGQWLGPAAIEELTDALRT
jgi:hypothetical protein